MKKRSAKKSPPSVGSRPRAGKKVVKKKIVKKTKKVLVGKRPALKKNPSRRLRQAEKSFSTSSVYKAKIKVIGIGGGGSSIVSDIGRSLHKASFVVADTDMRALKKRQGIKYFLFGQDLTHGLGTGLNTDLAQRAAQAHKEKISTLFKDQDIVIVIACLGGGLSSGATKVFVEAAKDFNGITLGIFTLPFKFEGKHKLKIATKALKELRRVLNVSITIPNERIFKVINSTTAITDAFSMVNRTLVESLESLIDLIYNPGIINIDFADLRAILSGRGNLAFLNTAEASGVGKADKITKEILDNPLYQNHNFTPEKVLFNIAGGGNLSMLEVDKISRAIVEKAPRAKIIFGISKDSQLKNRIKTTLLMTGPGAGVAAEVKPQVRVESSQVKAKTSKKKIKKPKKKVAKKSAAGTVVIPELEFASLPIMAGAESSFKKLSISEISTKKAIRRSGLEIKKAEEVEEQRKTQQEKEWEIPAFMRLKK